MKEHTSEELSWVVAEVVKVSSQQPSHLGCFQASPLMKLDEGLKEADAAAKAGSFKLERGDPRRFYLLRSHRFCLPGSYLARQVDGILAVL